MKTKLLCEKKNSEKVFALLKLIEIEIVER